MPKRLAIPVALLLASGCNEPEAPPPDSADAGPPAAQLPPDPFGPNPRHPPEVVRLMNLLPGIPAAGSREDILRHLGLPPCQSGSASGTHCHMLWPIAPGYRLCLAYLPVPPFVFLEASISAQGKPGRPADEYCTIYPYRNRDGMVAK